MRQTQIQLDCLTAPCSSYSHSVVCLYIAQLKTQMAKSGVAPAGNKSGMAPGNKVQPNNPFSCKSGKKKYCRNASSLHHTVWKAQTKKPKEEPVQMSEEELIAAEAVADAAAAALLAEEKEEEGNIKAKAEGRKNKRK